MSKHNIFIPIRKIDEERRMVYGIATAELPDKQGEICDYETSKPFYEKWSSDIEKASNGKSKGNLRVMHSAKVAGTIPQIIFNDDCKQIEICAKIVDDTEWKMVLEGAYTGFSQGGTYHKKWKDGEFTRYTSNPCEISLVDNPCLSTATFEVIKSDGSIELRKFINVENSLTKNIDKKNMNNDVKQGWQAIDGTFHLTKSSAIAHNETLEKNKQENFIGVVEKNEDIRIIEDKKEETNSEDKVQEVIDTEIRVNENQQSSNEISTIGTSETNTTTKIEDNLDNVTNQIEIKEESNEKSEKTSINDSQEMNKMYNISKYACEETYDAKFAIEALLAIQYLYDKESDETHNEDPSQSENLKIVIDKLKAFIASEIMENNEEMENEGEDSTEDNMEMSSNSEFNKSYELEFLKNIHKSALEHIKNIENEINNIKKYNNSDLVKRLEDKVVNDDLSKALTKIDTMQKRIDELEALPLPIKGSKLFIKNYEGEVGNVPVEVEIEKLSKDLSPKDRALEAFKIAHKNPTIKNL